MWRKVLAAVFFAAGSFMLAALLVAVDSGLSGLSKGTFVVAVVLTGLIPAGLLLAAWLLVRSANRVPEPTLSWVPANGMWLDQRFWAELPDPLPSRPRKGRRPLPTTGVPPDEVLRVCGPSRRSWLTIVAGTSGGCRSPGGSAWSRSDRWRSSRSSWWSPR